jgi:hypothetical protein
MPWEAMSRGSYAWRAVRTLIVEGTCGNGEASENAGTASMCSPALLACGRTRSSCRWRGVMRVQLVARYGDAATPLRLAAQLVQARPW